MNQPIPGGPRKVKRRQNVACDSCKLRRIKCNLLDLLSPTSTSSESGPSTLPPDVLVRNNPEVQCAPCRKKGLRCTTNQIENPSRPNKGGRRIDEARRAFGGHDVDRESGRSDQGRAYDVDGAIGVDYLDIDGTDSGARNTEMPGMGGPLDPTGQTLSLPAFYPTTDLHGSYLQYPALELPPEPITESIEGAITGTQPPDFDFDAFFSTTPSLSSDPSPYDSSWDQRDNRLIPPVGSSIPYNPDSDAELQGRRIWIEHARNHHSPKPNAPSTSASILQTPNLSEILDGHVTSTNSPAMGHGYDDMLFDPGLNAFINKSPTNITSSAVPSVTSRQLNDAGRKQIWAESAISLPSRIPFGSGNPTTAFTWRGGTSSPIDPWKVYSGDQLVVQWGRRENIQEGLADRALGIELSKHLIKVYFHHVHATFPALSPEGFYMDWEQAGQRSDMMSPAQEALCAVIEAWAARYSDSPVVLGVGMDRGSQAPKVLMPNGGLIPGAQGRAHWGRARLPVCNALMDRARRIIDLNGLLRRPSVTGVQALSLYNQLLVMTDQRDRAGDQWMQSQMMHSSVIEQMRLCDLMWGDTGDASLGPSELAQSMEQVRIKQRRLFWTMMVTDAFWAAGSATEPKIHDEDLEAARDWLMSVQEKLPRSTFKALAVFMLAYHRLAIVARQIAKKLARPNRRPGAVDIDIFCRTVRECWAEIKSIDRDFVAEMGDVLDSCGSSLPGFSPVDHFCEPATSDLSRKLLTIQTASIRLSCPFLLFVIHQIIKEQLSFRKSLSPNEESLSQSTKAAVSSLDGGVSVAGYDSNGPRSVGLCPSQDSPPAINAVKRDVESLEALNAQSVDILLESCRTQVRIVKALAHTGITQTAGVVSRIIIASAQFLAEVPVNEQGYPINTLGGHNWTWEAKQAEVGVCVEALYQVVAWADVAEVVDNVSLSMERMTPSPGVIEAWRSQITIVDNRVRYRKQKEIESESQLIGKALGFWPPTSIPSLLEKGMKELSLVNLPGPDDPESHHQIAGPEARSTAAPYTQQGLSWSKLVGLDPQMYPQIPVFNDTPRAVNSIADAVWADQGVRPLNGQPGLTGHQNDYSQTSLVDGHGNPLHFDHPVNSLVSVGGGQINDGAGMDATGLSSQSALMEGVGLVNRSTKSGMDGETFDLFEPMAWPDITFEANDNIMSDQRDLLRGGEAIPDVLEVPIGAGRDVGQELDIEAFLESLAAGVDHIR